MKKATLKTYLIVLLVLLLSIALTLTAFACSKKPGETPEENESTSDFTSLVSNGDFSSHSSDSSLPYTPSSWSSYTPSGYSADNKVAGIVDTGADYDKNRSKWGDLANPYGEVTDNKVLMIYNKEDNVYGYYNTFTTTSSAYYSVSIKVKVVNVAAEEGATIRIYTDNGYAEFQKINATSEFTTYTFYLQAPSADSATVTVRLSLGYDDHKVSGYAFFDDVVATKIKASDYAAAQAGDTVKLVSFLYPDGEFNYYNFSSSSDKLQTPSSWSWNKGENVGGKSVPTSELKSGVISTEDSVWSAWTTEALTYGANPGLPVANSDDKFVMAIIENKTSANEYNPTAGYYASKSDIKIDRASLYEISVWVKAIVDSDDSIQSYENKGARVVLKGSDTYESAVINTTDKLGVNGGWAKVTFYVLGNQFRAQNFKIQLWIGNDKSNDTLTQGKVFFDKLSVTAVNTGDKTRDQIVTEYAAKEGNFEVDYVSYTKFIDLKTEDTKLLVNDNFTNVDATTGLPTTLEFSPVDNVIAGSSDVIAKVISNEDLSSDTTDWKQKYGIDENPLYPYSFSPVLIVNNTIPCAYTVRTVDLFEIKQSLSYRISVWIKTIGLDDGKNITLKLVDEDDADVESFSVNTAEYENALTNDYAEYSFYLTGTMPVSTNNTETSKFVRLVISNGSGTQYDPASYQKGAFVIANINMEQITYTEYDSNSSSGTYTKAKDYAENSATVTNGNFNSYDRKETTFGDDGFVAMTDKDNNDHLVGAVSGWTSNVNNKYGTTKTGGEWLPDYPLSRADDNSNNHFTAAVQGKNITTIQLVGTNYDKTFNTDAEWSKVLDVNTITGKVSWKSGIDLANGDYTVKIKVDEKELNNLIAGIINVNAPAAYFAQFGLNADQIYDNWSTTKVPSTETAAKAVTFGAPNLLMITTRDGASIKLKNTYVDEKATNDMTKTAAIKSPSISLSGNSYYLLKCYGKAVNGAIGQVYVTTTSTDATISSYSVVNTSGWVEYNFLVETGLSSVSAQFEIYFGEKGDGDTAYSGTLFFDSFSYTSLTEDEYTTLSDPANGNANTKFTTITFDNASASETAIAPSGFSASNSSSSNSTTQVSGIIAKDNYTFTTANGDSNIGIYTSETTEENGQTVTKDVIDPDSVLSASYIFSSEGMEDGATVGDYLLMINNRKATYQSYYMSSLSLASDSYYKFSAYVRTAKIEKDSFAKVYVSISDEPLTFEVNTEYDKDGNDIENKWQKLTFYFKNEKTSSVSASLYFQLGENTDEGKMKGYLFVDNISLEKITEDAYTALTANNEVYEKDANDEFVLDANGEKILTAASKEYRLKNKVTVLKENETKDEGDDDDDDEENPKTPLNTTLLWTYITSIAIAVVLIAVIVAWLIRKYRRPKTGAPDQKKAKYDRTNKKSEDDDAPKSTGSARDEFKD